MKTLVLLTHFNRTKLAIECLKTLTKPEGATIIIDDDGSEDNPDLLKPYCDILNIHKHEGVQSLRRKQLDLAYFSDFDRVYFTDTDCIHDPDWHQSAEALYLHTGLPVSLYNTRYHAKEITQDLGIYDIRLFAPGCSIYMDRATATMWAGNAYFNNVSWDYCNHPSLKDYRSHMLIATSKISYIDHIGEGGLHHDKNNPDVATNPSKFLIDKRKEVVDKIKEQN